MCPSNIEITQFHKRLVELFDNLNTRTVEEKKYYALYNTVQEVKKLFSNQVSYLKEINQTYKDSATNKKNKEALLFNIKNIITILGNPMK
jgi:hypothetical protein